MLSISQIEKKYHIVVCPDNFWNPLSNRMEKRYKMFTLDGCPWENGLSYKGLLKECEMYKNLFLKIKENL